MYTTLDSMLIKNFERLSDEWSGSISPTYVLDHDADDGTKNLQVALPGFKKDQVNVDFVDGYLNITSKLEEEEAKNFVKPFKLSFKVSDKFNCAESSAEMSEGILSVMIPPASDHLQRKSISIS
tara:strand:+ start:420 stop:791 length:372 start_codon:yes stop_codon:yes gene_type:complete